MLNSLARQILNRNPFLGRVRKGGGGRERDNANQNITEQTNFSVDCSLVMKIAKVKMRKRERVRKKEKWEKQQNGVDDDDGRAKTIIGNSVSSGGRRQIQLP